MPDVITPKQSKLHPMEVYNCVYGLDKIIEFSSACFMLENSPYWAATSKLNIELPSLHDVNKLIAHTVSAITTPTRFGSGNLQGLAMNLTSFGVVDNLNVVDYGPFMAS